MDKTEAMQGNLQEKVTAFNVVQSFTREQEEQQSFHEESLSLLHESLVGARWSAINATTVGFLTGVAPVLVVFAASFFILNEQLTLGQMVLFYSYLGSFYRPVNRLSELTQVLSTSKAAIDRIPPGLTGIGSVVFRDEESLLDAVPAEDRDRFHDEVIAPYKGLLELWYVGHRNLGTYFALIFLTAWSIIRPGSLLYRRLFRDLPKAPRELSDLLEGNR